jgi:holo-[acyl-carrier protein] synthase
MIINIGCDIIRIARIEKSIFTYGDRFLRRIFSEQELDNAPSHYKKKCVYFANRFAAKEAFAKALGTGIGENIKFFEIEVLNHASGQPYIKYPQRLGDFKVHISISDEGKYSVAFVTLEQRTV